MKILRFLIPIAILSLLLSCTTTENDETSLGSGLAFYLLRPGTETEPESNISEERLLLRVDEYVCFKTAEDIAIRLDGQDAVEFKRLTAIHAGRSVVITVNGDVVAAPVVREEIHTREIILVCPDRRERDRIFKAMVR